MAKPSMPGMDSDQWEMTPGGPLSKETATTYGGGKPGKAPTQKAPTPPDPFALIEAQGRENRVNEVGPSGSTRYSRDPETGVWTANRTFSPELQGLYNQQVSMMQGDPNAYNEQVANAMYGRQRTMLDPLFEQQNRALEQKLADQGLPIGSEAYGGEWDRNQRMQNEAYGQAQQGATLAGTQVGMQQRQNEFNQMAALLGGQQVGPTAPIDVTGPFASQYQGQLNSVNAANDNAASRNQQTTSGAATLATILASMFCSKEFKENNSEIDHNQVLESVSALPVEKWTYKDGASEHIGPYAEDFKELFGLGDGKVIPIVDAFGVCLSAIKALTARVNELERARA